MTKTLGVNTFFALITNYFSSLKLVTVFFFSLTIMSCTTLTLSEYQARDFNSYQLKQTKNDIKVAIYPMLDKKEQIKYFGTNLNNKGIFPLSILVKNDTPSKSVLFSHELIEVSLNKKYEGIGNSNSETVLIAGTLLLSPILVMAGAKMQSDSTIINHSLTKHKLHKTIVSPGKLNHGFIYIPRSEKDKAVNIIVNLQDLKTNKNTSFPFSIKLNN